MKLSPVIALDLARVTGFAIGFPGDAKPISGTICFASAGSSHEAVFAAALKWSSDLFQLHAPSTVVWEAPMPTSFNRGSTNSNTTTLLYGLPAIIGAVAFLLKIHDVRKAETRLVRKHFIGSNPKRVEAKRLTMRQCRALGWPVEDDNEADACAIWSYMCSLLDPKLAIGPTPLFLQGRK